MTPDERAAWLEERLTYVGASEVAEVAGLSPWGDPIGLWARKRGEEAGPDETFRMRFGTAVEPLIGDFYEEATGRRLRRWNGPIRHPEFEHLAANPDFRIVGERGLVQAKSSDHDAGWGDPGDESGAAVPIHYRVQAQAEMACTGMDFVDFAVLHGARAFQVYVVPRDEALIADLLEDVREFWQHVEDGTMPEPSENSGPALARRFPKETGVGKIANAKQELELAAFLEARAVAKAADAAKDEAANRVKQLIGSASWIEGAGHRFTWSRGERTTVAWREVAAGLRSAVDSLLGVLDRVRDDDPDDWALVERVRESIPVLESLHSKTEPSDRLNVGKPK